MDANINRRPVVVTAIVASCLALSSGLTYRVLASRLAAPVPTGYIAPDLLQGLPMQIGVWTGEDVLIDETIVRRTGADAHISRRYSRHNGVESVSLYAACGVNLGKVLEHPPERCYSGAGWKLVNRRPVEMSVSDGSMLPCNILQFVRGDLLTERVTVLHYFVADGLYCGNISRSRSRTWQILAAVDYVAQVQIVASSRGALSADAATRLVSDFAVDSAPAITQLFENLEKELSSGSSDRACEER